jgi:hypothetical protein
VESIQGDAGEKLSRLVMAAMLILPAKSFSQPVHRLPAFYQQHAQKRIPLPNIVKYR